MNNTVIIAGVQSGQFTADDGREVSWAKCLVLEAMDSKGSRGYVAEWYKLRPDLAPIIKDMPGMYDAEIAMVRDYKSGIRGFKIMELTPARVPLGAVR